MRVAERNRSRLLDQPLEERLFLTLCHRWHIPAAEERLQALVRACRTASCAAKPDS